ncbi:MAG: ABC transporter permease subunit [Thermoplasmatota archaeon]
MNVSYFKWTLKREWKGGLIYFAILTAWILLVAAVFPSFRDSISNPFTDAGKIRIEEMNNGTYNMTWEELPGYDIHALVGMKEEPDLQELMTLFNESGIDIGDTPGNISEIIDDLEELMTRINESGVDFDEIPVNISGIVRDLRVLSAWMNESGLDIDESPINVTEILQNEKFIRQMLAPQGFDLIFLGGGHQKFIEKDGPNRFFFVLYLNSDLEFYLSDLVDAKNLTTATPFDAYLEDNAFVEGFVGDLDVMDFASYTGFMIVEFLGMWTLLIGIYAAIKGLSFVTRLIDDKSLDILLATGYTRERMILEKFMTSMIIIIFLHIGSFIMLGLGGVALGEPVDWGKFAIVFLTSVPFALSALMIGVFISSFMNDYRSALWTVLGVMLFQYMIMFIGNILESLEWMLYFTIYGYWDPSEIIYGSSFPYLDTIVLILFSAVMFTASIIWFRKRDLPT